MAERIQLSRRKGWKMPENTVKVSRPGKWGNPFVVTEKVPAGRELKGIAWGCFTVPTVEDAVECYRLMLAERPDMIEDAKAELAGKNLACWCRLDQPCHADVLLELANAPSVSGSHAEREDGRSPAEAEGWQSGGEAATPDLALQSKGGDE